MRNVQKKLDRLPYLKNPTTFNEKDRLGNGLDFVRADM